MNLKTNDSRFSAVIQKLLFPMLKLKVKVILIKYFHHDILEILQKHYRNDAHILNMEITRYPEHIFTAKINGLPENL